MVSGEFLERPVKTELELKSSEELQQDLMNAMDRAKARIAARKLTEAATKMMAKSEEAAAKAAKKIKGTKVDLDAVPDKLDLESVAPWAKELELEERAKKAKEEATNKEKKRFQRQEASEAMARLYPDLEGKTAEEIGTASNIPDALPALP